VRGHRTQKGEEFASRRRKKNPLIGRGIFFGEDGGQNPPPQNGNFKKTASKIKKPLNQKKALGPSLLGVKFLFGGQRGLEKLLPPKEKTLTLWGEKNFPKMGGGMAFFHKHTQGKFRRGLI